MYHCVSTECVTFHDRFWCHLKMANEKKNVLYDPSLPTKSYNIASRIGTAVFNELSTLKT